MLTANQLGITEAYKPISRRVDYGDPLIPSGMRMRWIANEIKEIEELLGKAQDKAHREEKRK